MSHVFACLMWIVVIGVLWAWETPSSARLPQYEEGIAAMLTIIKASLFGSALMLMGGCASYSTKTGCVNQGADCQCIRYTTINRSWVDCR
jgi:hypothetical protein